MLSKTNKKSGSRKVTVSRDVKDYGNEPFFVKKAEAAKKTVDRYGLPKSLATVKK